MPFCPNSPSSLPLRRPAGCWVSAPVTVAASVIAQAGSPCPRPALGPGAGVRHCASPGGWVLFLVSAEHFRPASWTSGRRAAWARGANTGASQVVLRLRRASTGIGGPSPALSGPRLLRGWLSRCLCHSLRSSRAGPRGSAPARAACSPRPQQLCCPGFGHNGGGTGPGRVGALGPGASCHLPGSLQGLPGGEAGRGFPEPAGACGRRGSATARGRRGPGHSRPASGTLRDGVTRRPGTFLSCVTAGPTSSDAGGGVGTAGTGRVPLRPMGHRPQPQHQGQRVWSLSAAWDGKSLSAPRPSAGDRSR